MAVASYYSISKQVVYRMLRDLDINKYGLRYYNGDQERIKELEKQILELQEKLQEKDKETGKEKANIHKHWSKRWEDRNDKVQILTNNLTEANEMIEKLKEEAIKFCEWFVSEKHQEQIVKKQLNSGIRYNRIIPQSYEQFKLEHLNKTSNE